MVTSDTRCVSNITLNLPHNPVKQAPCYSFSHVWKQKLPNRNQLAEDQWLTRSGARIPPEQLAMGVNVSAREARGGQVCPGGRTGDSLAGRSPGNWGDPLYCLCCPHSRLPISLPPATQPQGGCQGNAEPGLEFRRASRRWSSHTGPSPGGELSADAPGDQAGQRRPWHPGSLARLLSVGRIETPVAGPHVLGTAGTLSPVGSSPSSKSGERGRLISPSTSAGV